MVTLQEVGRVQEINHFPSKCHEDGYRPHVVLLPKSCQESLPCAVRAVPEGGEEIFQSLPLAKIPSIHREQHAYEVTDTLNPSVVGVQKV